MTDVNKPDYNRRMSGFTKLFSTIVDSTVWREPNHIRLVWITMLAKADRNGRVLASLPGLADAARVSIPECQEALVHLSSPDEWSRTKTHEGRRIEEIDGGWRLLNYLKYRELRDETERRIQVREAVRRHRERKSESLTVIRGKPRKAQAEAEAEAEAEKRTPSSLRSEGKPLAWTIEAVAIWEEKFGGKPPGGYGGIGKALKDAVHKFGAADVLKGFRAYLTQSDPKYASPSAYASKIASWVNLERPRPIVAPSTEEQAFGLIQREGWLREFEAERGKSATVSAVEFTRNKIGAIT